MINCIHVVLLLLVSVVLLKCTSFSLVIHFLKFVRLFHLQVLLIIIVPVSLVIFFHPQHLIITLSKILLLSFSKSRMEMFLVNFSFPTMLLVFLLIFHFKKLLAAINLFVIHNPNLNITKKELKKLFFLPHHSFILFLMVNFIVKLMDQPWVLLWLLSQLKFFIGVYESEQLNEYDIKKPKFNLTFIDDLLAAFDKEQHSLNFLNFFK